MWTFGAVAIAVLLELAGVIDWESTAGFVGLAISGGGTVCIWITTRVLVVLIGIRCPNCGRTLSTYVMSWAKRNQLLKDGNCPYCMSQRR